MHGQRVNYEPMERILPMEQNNEPKWCPICKLVCTGGTIETTGNGGEKKALPCSFYHQKEGRCLVKMIEFDLFNVARALDVISNS